MKSGNVRWAVVGTGGIARRSSAGSTSATMLQIMHTIQQKLAVDRDGQLHRRDRRVDTEDRRAAA